MKKRLLVWVGLVLLALAAIAAMALYRFPALRGYLLGEASFHGHPTSYWREVVRGAGPHGAVPRMVYDQFVSAPEAVPVLLQSIHDPDANTRSAVLILLRATGARSPETMLAFTDAIHDSDPDVRIHAIGALSAWGSDASAALPALTPLAQDPDEHVAGYAQFALWQIDAGVAADIAGWRPIPEDEWGFTAKMPASVEVKKSDAPGARSQAVVHFYSARDDAGSFTLSVGQYPDGAISTLPPTALLDRERQVALLMVRDGQLEKEESIELQGRKGREYKLRMEKVRLSWTIRSYWERDRIYTLVADTRDEQPNAAAVDYFFHSFRFPN